MITSGIALVVLSLVSSVTPVDAQGTAPVPAKAARESLLKADHALSADARARGLGAAVGDRAAADAIFLYDGAPIVSGRANVLAMMQAQTGLAAIRVQLLPLVAAVSSDGSLGVTYGVMAISPVATPDSAIRFGKYIATWRKVANGDWQPVGFVEMGLGTEKFVMPAGMTRPMSPLPDVMSGAGAAFARADIDFARMAGAQGAPVAFGAFAAPDGTTLPGSGEIVIGPTAIKARMFESPAANAKWEWRPVYAEAAASGDLGFTIGEVTIAIPGASGVTEYRSKYLTVWRRQPDGTIRYIVDGGNDR